MRRTGGVAATQRSRTISRRSPPRAANGFHPEIDADAQRLRRCVSRRALRWRPSAPGARWGIGSTGDHPPDSAARHCDPSPRRRRDATREQSRSRRCDPEGGHADQREDDPAARAQVGDRAHLRPRAATRKMPPAANHGRRPRMRLATHRSRRHRPNSYGGGLVLTKQPRSQRSQNSPFCQGGLSRPGERRRRRTAARQEPSIRRACSGTR